MDTIFYASLVIMSIIILRTGLYTFFIRASSCTYIPIWVPVKDHQQYQRRKSFIAENLMIIIGFDLLIQFDCASFEGSVNDQKILSNGFHA